MIKKIIIRFFRKLGFLKYFNFTTSIKVNNKKIIIPVNAGIGVSYLWLSEAWMISVPKQLAIAKSSTIIDVGVNIGQTLVKLKSIYNEKNKERKEAQSEVQKVINQLNYKIYRIHKNDNNSFMKIEYLDKLEIHSDLKWCDYILDPSALSFNDTNEKS